MAMRTFGVPQGKAGLTQIYGIQESVDSNLERMFNASSRRSALIHSVGRTASTAGGVDGKMQRQAQERECDAVISFHAGKALELSMQLIYAVGMDRIMGRASPAVDPKLIQKDTQKGHSLKQLRKRIIKELDGNDMENAFEDAFQTAINEGLVDLEVDGKLVGFMFASAEDCPFHEKAIRGITDGMEVTQDHTRLEDALFSRSGPSDFVKDPMATFADFLDKADKSYYESKNMRWMDYSARDHEHGRPYAVAGTDFFARLSKGLVALANQEWVWHPDFRRRWWERRRYSIRRLLEGHAQQNFSERIEFPDMIPLEDAMAEHLALFEVPAARVKRGHSRLRRKMSFTTQD